MLPSKEKGIEYLLRNWNEKATHIEIKRSTNNRKEPQDLIKPTDTTMVPYFTVFDERME
jgi:hypothetical protein